jgi:CheY-like chemotaxis protein
MPGMSGLEATHAIKSRWPEVRVVLVTMYPTSRTEPFADEADAFLLKGFRATELRDAVFGAGGPPPRRRPGEGAANVTDQTLRPLRTRPVHIDIRVVQQRDERRKSDATIGDAPRGSIFALLADQLTSSERHRDTANGRIAHRRVK